MGRLKLGLGAGVLLCVAVCGVGLYGARASSPAPRSARASSPAASPWLWLPTGLSLPGLSRPQPVPSPRETPSPVRLPLSWGRQPLRFEPCALAPGGPDFVSRGQGYALYVQPTAATACLRAGGRRTAVTLKLAGARPNARPVLRDRQPGVSNYYLGNDARQWRTGVPHYAQAGYQDVYPGIDLVYYGNEDGRLEHDFIVAPGADPAQISLCVDGAESVRCDETGDLVVQAGGGELRLHQPVAYQEVDGRRAPVAAEYVAEDTRVRFALGEYDATRPLVVDPVLVWSTYLGGSGDDGASGIAVDASGNAYVTGNTMSTDYPTLNATQGTLAGGGDVFVTKLTPSGTISYSTYLGGSSGDGASGVALDASGNACVVGHTSSTDYPTLGAAQAANAGGLDAFVSKLTPDGALSFSTYLGGSDQDQGYAIAVDAGGNMYVGGETLSSDFPALNAQRAYVADDGFVAKFGSDGTLFLSTFLGGWYQDRLYAVALDASGNIWVAGHTHSPNYPTLNAVQSAHGGGTHDGFVSKLTPTGALSFSSYLGGNGDDMAYDMAIDASGSAYVAGWTSSTNYPVLNAAQATRAGAADAFVTKLTAGGALSFSTYLGGSGDDYGQGIAADASGCAYVTGCTGSTNFPTLNAAQASHAGGTDDAFVTKLTAAGVLSYSTYLGGSGVDQGNGIAVDASGCAYVTGYTTSTNFPTLNAAQASNAGGQDAFVTKLSAGEPPAAPTNVAASDTDTTKVQVTWTASAGATGYTIWRHTTNASASATQLGTATGTSYDDTSAVAGTTYYFWVKATNAGGASGFSASDSGVRPVLSLVVSPTSVSVPEGGTNTFTVRLASAPASEVGVDVDVVSGDPDLSVTGPRRWSAWGGPGTGDGQFGHGVSGVAVDAAGYVYVADAGNHRIQKFTRAGAFVAKWGSQGAGNGQFEYPRDVAADTLGNVYVADANNHRIQKFTGGGVFVAKWGSEGAGVGQFRGPYGVDVDSAGSIYVADVGNHRIQKFSNAMAYVAQWGTYGNGDGQLNAPLGVAVDGAGHVFVADMTNWRVQKFSNSGGFLAKWGSIGSQDGQFNMPWGIATDPFGNVYVSDRSNYRIQKFSGDGAFLAKWGTWGSAVGQFHEIDGSAAVDSAGTLYVPDSYQSRVQRLAPGLVFTPTSWNTPQTVTLAAAEDADFINGSATIRCSSAATASVDVTATEVDNDLPAPTNVAATDNDTTKIRVTWDYASEFVSYDIYRATTNDVGAAAKLTALPVAGASYEDTSPVAGTTYYYWLKTVSPTATSGFSASDSGVRPTSIDAGLANAAWPKFRQGALNRGLGVASGCNGRLRWEYTTGAGVYASPVVGGDGTVYVGSADHQAYALDGATGARRWAYDTGNVVYSSGALSATGALVLGANDGRAYALNTTTGAKLWEYATGGAIGYSSPTIAPDGTVYVGSADYRLYALDGATGAKRWEFAAGLGVASSPALGADGTVYVGSYDKKVYALDGATGAKRWEYLTGGTVGGSPAVGADGTVYIGSADAKVYALDGATGAKRWEYATGGAVSSSPAIAADGTVYIGSDDKKVYALHGATGAKVWEYLTGGYVRGTPAVATDGTVYVGAYDNKLYALHGATGAQVWNYAVSAAIVSSPAIGADGTVYVGCHNGRVYALGTQTITPAAPTNVAATDNDPTKVQVTWTAATYSDGYDVYRATTNDSGAASKLNASPVTGTSYDDTTAVPGTTYYYWVKARNGALVSDFSASDSGVRYHSLVVSPTSVTVPEGGTNTFTVRLASAPASDVTVAVDRVSGDTDLTLAAPVLGWTVWGNEPGELRWPCGLAVDAAGNVYVADTNYHRIRKRDTAGVWTTWGSEGSAAGQFSWPAGVAVDAAGNVYVADTENHRIQKRDTAGVWTTWGNSGSAAGQFSYPSGVAVDAAGNVYVADRDNHRLQKRDTAGVWTTWGSYGSAAGQFAWPSGVAVDAAGNVYVADAGNDRIQKQDTAGVWTTWGSSGSAAGQFNGPRGVAVDAAGNVYVADTDNDRGQKFVPGLVFTPANWNTPQTVTLAAAEDVDQTNGSATFRCSADLAASVDVTATEADNDLLAPTNVAATDNDPAKVRVTWDAVSGATGYDVYRATTNDSAAASKINASTVAGTSYDDTSAVAGTTYYYWVKATSAAAASDFSASDSGVRLAAAPSPPANVAASDLNTLAVRVTWTAAAGATGYDVYRATTNDSGAATRLNGTPVTGTSYDDTSAVPGTTYWYWVKALNAGGASGYSNGDSGTRPSSVNAGLAGSNWPKFRATAPNPGRADGRGCVGAMRWAYVAYGDVLSSPAIGAQGIVYVGASDYRVYALEGASGAKRWEFLANGAVLSSPAVGASGLVYVGSFDTKVYALEALAGSKRWEFATGGQVWSSPAVGSDGTVYVGSLDRKVYALDGATGARRWEYLTGGAVYSSPAVGYDGTVYVGSNDRKVYALDPVTGAKRWEYLTGGVVQSSPAVAPDGTVYVGSYDGKVYALNGATGALVWSYTTGGPIYLSSPALGADGTVYIGSNDAKVYALDPATGVKRWEYLTGGAVYASPAVGGDGTVYVGSLDARLYALDGATGARRWDMITGGQLYSSPALGSDGSVYFGSQDNKLRALGAVPAPTGVSATDTDPAKVVVSWSAVATATGYEVYRNTTNDPATAYKVADTTLTSFPDGSAATGTVYWYWVKAKNNTILSDWSNSDSGLRPGAITTSLTTLSVREGASATYQVRLATAPLTSVTVAVARLSGDADLSAAPASLTFTSANWNTWQTVTVAADQDADIAAGSAVIRASATGWTSADVTATEVDDDASILVSTPTLSVPEGGSATFDVLLGGQPSSNVTVSVGRLSGDADLSAAPASLTFTPTNWNVPQTVTVSAAQDADVANGSAVIRASATGWTAASVTATEVDDDGRLAVSKPNVTVAEGGTATFGVTLAGQPADVVVVTVARVSGDTDLSVSAGASLTFTSATWNVPQLVTLSALEDVDAANGSALFRLTATGAGAGWPTADVTATEADNDKLVVVSPARVTAAEGGSATFGVRLAGQPAANVTVSVARLSGDSDLSVSSGASLTFTSTNWSVPQTVTIAAAEDEDAIAGSAVFRASAPGWTAADATVVEADNDALLVALPKTVNVGEGGSAQVGLTLGGRPAANVIVTTAWVSGDPDVTLTAGASLTFTSANWNVPQYVTLAAAQDIDLLNGTALFRASASGWTPATITANEVDNDAVLVVSKSNVTVGEGGTATFTVQLGAQPAAAVTVSVVRFSGDTSITVTGGSTLSFTPSDWNLPKTVRLSAAQDFDAVNGSAVIRASAAGWASADVTATEADNDGYIAVTRNAVTVGEGGSATFGVSLAGQPAANVTVTVARVSGDTDLSVTGGASLVFAPTNWNVPKIVTLSAAHDTDIANGSAVFQASAAGWTSADVTATEADDDQVLIADRSALTVSEGGAASFTVRLGGQPSADVAVSVARLSGDSDLSVTGGAALTFTSANWNVPQTVTLAAAADLDAVAGTAVIRASAAGWASADVTATEADDDAVIRVSRASLTVAEGGTSTFTVRLGGQPAGDVIVQTLRTSGDTDLSVTAGATLVFNAGNWNLAQTVTLAAAQDADVAADSAVFTLSAPGWRSATVTATEADDDAFFALSKSTLTVGEGGSATFTIALGGQPAADLTVSVARVSGDTDMSVSPASLTFTSLNWNAPQTVTIAAAQDVDVANSSATFRVSAAGWQAADLVATEADDDARIVAGKTTLAVSEGGNVAVDVTLGGQPTGDVTVSVARLSGDADLSATPATLTFTSANWNTPQPVTIAAAHDTDATNGSAVFRLSASGWTAADITATEVDDDAVLVLDKAAMTVGEASTSTFTVCLGGVPAVNTTVTVSRLSGDTSLSVSAGASLVFTPANWNVPQTVTIAAAHDLDMAAGTAVFRVAATGWASADLTATEGDDDAFIIVTKPSVTVSEGGTTTFGVRLAGQPAGSVTVTVARVSGDTDISVTGGASLVFAPTNWNVPKTVTLTAAQDVDVANGSAVIRASAPGLTSADVTATEADDDALLIATPGYVLVGEGGTATVGVTLGGQPAGDVTVSVARTSGDTDLSVTSPATLTFTSANWNVPQTVTLAAANDLDAVDGTALFTLSAPGWLSAEVTVIEADSGASLVASPTALTVAEGGTATFGISLAGQPADLVVVTLTRTSGDPDVNITSSYTLTFASANWNVPQMVTIAAANDADTANDAVVFRASAPGWQPVDIAVTEIDDASLGARLGAPSGTLKLTVTSGVGDARLLTASGLTGEGLSYTFWLGTFDSATTTREWSILAGPSAADKCIWRPTQAGDYQLRVEATRRGAPAGRAEVNCPIPQP